jgi:hypothetical protein
LGGETSIPASVGLLPVEGLEQPPAKRKAAVETITNGTASKVVFVKVARQLCQLPVQ